MLLYLLNKAKNINRTPDVFYAIYVDGRNVLSTVWIEQLL